MANNTNKLYFSRILTTLGTVAIISACGGGGSFSVSSDNYNGPGSRWDVALKSDSTFSITKRETATSPIVLTVDGTYSELANGFTKLTVASASGTDAPTAGDTAWGLNVPGYALMLRPIDATSDQMIPMVSAGTCPTSNVNANWVLVKKDSGSSAADAGRDFFGTFQYLSGTNTPSLPARFDLQTLSSLGAQPLSTSTCADGIMVVNNDAEMYLTSNGGAIVRTGFDTPSDETDDNFIFALSAKSIGSLSALDGNYAGMLFDDNSSNGQKIQPVSFSCSAGSCSGNIVTNIDTGATSADSVTVSLNSVDSLGTGLVTGTITSSEPGSVTGNLGCMADIDALSTGKVILNCVGQSPGDVTKMFNVILVSR